MRLVLDPGVMVSAAVKPSGTCGRLLELILAGPSELIVSPMLISELQTVLLREKFRRYLSEDEAMAFAGLVAASSKMRADAAMAHTATSDPKDNYLVCLASESEANYLVSGDAHLHAVKGVSVLSPAELLAVL